MNKDKFLSKGEKPDPSDGLGSYEMKIWPNWRHQKPIHDPFNENKSFLNKLDQMMFFAKKGTSEKVFTTCSKDNAGELMTHLGEIYGGTWVVVGSLKHDEMLMFDDGVKYEGLKKDSDVKYVKTISKNPIKLL